MINQLTIVAITILKGIAVAIYQIFKLLPQQNKVVLITRQSRTTSLDFQLLADYLAAEHPQTKVVILNHRMTNYLRSIGEIILEMYHLATAKGCVIDTYIIPVSILHHRPNLVIVQIWHALGAIKKFGYSALDKKEGSPARLAAVMNMHRHYSYITVGGQASIPIFAQAFNAPADIIKPIGQPRVDYLVNPTVRQANKRLVEQAFPQLKGKQVIIYAPTFRKKEHVAPHQLFQAIDSDRQVLILSLHPLDTTTPPNDSGIIVNTQLPLTTLLAAADALITDYSAAAFEAAIMDIPVYFYPYDLDRYKKNRGLALDYQKEMPGLIAQNAVELMQAVTSQQYDQAALRAFADKYVNLQDGTATAKIVELLDL